LALAGKRREEKAAKGGNGGCRPGGNGLF